MLAFDRIDVSSFVLQGFMGSIEEGLNRIVEAITPRGLGGHGPRKVKVSNNNNIIIIIIIITITKLSNLIGYQLP